MIGSLAFRLTKNTLGHNPKQTNTQSSLTVRVAAERSSFSVFDLSSEIREIRTDGAFVLTGAAFLYRGSKNRPCFPLSDSDPHNQTKPKITREQNAVKNLGSL